MGEPIASALPKWLGSDEHRRVTPVGTLFKCRVFSPDSAPPGALGVFSSLENQGFETLMMPEFRNCPGSDRVCRLASCPFHLSGFS